MILIRGDEWWEMDGMILIRGDGWWVMGGRSLLGVVGDGWYDSYKR